MPANVLDLVKPALKLPSASRLRRKATPAPLEVYELLEDILLALPMRDLLLAQRVCKRWHNLINASNRIQRALYFLPDQIPTSTTSTTFEPNLLLQDAFQSYFIFPPHHTVYTERNDLWNTRIVLQSTLEPWRKAFRYKEASWRKMLVIQPPVALVIVWDHRIAPDYDDCFVEYARNANGVRMGELLQLREDTII